MKTRKYWIGVLSALSLAPMVAPAAASPGRDDLPRSLGAADGSAFKLAAETVPGASLPTPPTAAPLPPPPPAPASPPLTVYGSYFTRYELRRNYDKLGVSGGRFTEGDRAVYRLRTALATGPIDIGGDKAVVLYFAPQASGFYPGAGTAGSSNATIGESDLGVVEGYLRLKSVSWDLDVGRFIMNYGNSAVIGSLDWHQSARSFQGLRYGLHLPEKAFVDVFLTQQAEGVPGETRYAGGDEYFAGVYSGLGSMVGLKALDIYALTKIWGGRAATPMSEKVPVAVQATIGSLIKGDVGILDYNLEGGVQFGKRRLTNMMVNSNRSVFAYQVEGELGVKLLPGFRAAGYGAYASGENGTGKLNNWDELYPTTHMFFGLMDIIGIRSNIADAALRLSYATPGTMVFKLDVHNFFRPEDANAAVMGKQNGYVGSEANLHVIHKLGKGMTLRGMYGAFLPNDEVYPRDSLAHYLEVELRYDI